MDIKLIGTRRLLQIQTTFLPFCTRQNKRTFSQFFKLIFSKIFETSSHSNMSRRGKEWVREEVDKVLLNISTRADDDVTTCKVIWIPE